MWTGRTGAHAICALPTYTDGSQGGAARDDDDDDEQVTLVRYKV